MILSSCQVMSVIGGKAENICSQRVFQLLTLTGSRGHAAIMGLQKYRKSTRTAHQRAITKSAPVRRTDFC